MRYETPNPLRLTIARWFLDIFKIGCGAALGYAILLAVTFAFFDVTFPLIQATATWVFGTDL